MQAKVTGDTNTIDAFCRRWLGNDNDDTMRNFIYWNIEWMNHNPTWFLPIGVSMWYGPPTVAQNVLAIGNEIIVIDDSYIHLPA